MSEKSLIRTFSFKEVYDKKKHVFEVVGFLAVAAGLALQINESSKIAGYKMIQAITILLFFISVWWLLNEFVYEINSEIERLSEKNKERQGEYIMLQILLTFPQTFFSVYIFYNFFYRNFATEIHRIFILAFLPCVALFSLGANIFIKSALYSWRWFGIILSIIYGVIISLSFSFGFDATLFQTIMIGSTISVLQLLFLCTKMKIWICTCCLISAITFSLFIVSYLQRNINMESSINMCPIYER